MVDENTEKLDNNKKKHKAKKADARARLRRVTSRPKHLKRGNPTTTKPHPSQRNWQLFPICFVFQQSRGKEEVIISYI